MSQTAGTAEVYMSLNVGARGEYPIMFSSGG